MTIAKPHAQFLNRLLYRWAKWKINHFGLLDLCKSEGSSFAVWGCVGLCAGSCRFFKQEVYGGQEQRGWHKKLYRTSPFLRTCEPICRDWRIQGLSSKYLRFPLLNLHRFWQLWHFECGPKLWRKVQSGGRTWSWTLLSNLFATGFHASAVLGSAVLIPTLRCCYTKYRWRLHMVLRGGGFIFGEWGFVSEFYIKV